jgi:putative exporter of polyketide antibiotics
MLLPLAATVLLLLVAARLGAGRDIGTGLLPTRDEAEPRASFAAIAAFRRRDLVDS